MAGESNLTLTGLVMRFAQLANLTGQPSITLPVGQDASGTDPPCWTVSDDTLCIFCFAIPHANSTLAAACNARQNLTVPQDPAGYRGQILGQGVLKDCIRSNISAAAQTLSHGAA